MLSLNAKKGSRQKNEHHRNFFGHFDNRFRRFRRNYCGCKRQKRNHFRASILEPVVTGDFEVIYFEINTPIVSKKNTRPIWYNSRTGKPQLGKSLRLQIFEEEILRELQLQMKTQGMAFPIEHPVRVIYHFYFPHKRRPDIDNLIASVNDSLQAAGIIKNDRLIDAVVAQCFNGHKSPQVCRVQIYWTDPKKMDT